MKTWDIERSICHARHKPSTTPTSTCCFCGVPWRDVTCVLLLQGKERQAWGECDGEGGLQRQRRDEGLRTVLERSAVPRGHSVRGADCARRAHRAGTEASGGRGGPGGGVLGQ